MNLEDYYSTSELKERGWTTAKICKYLKSPHYCDVENQKEYYLKVKVKEIENEDLVKPRSDDGIKEYKIRSFKYHMSCEFFEFKCPFCDKECFEMDFKPHAKIYSKALHVMMSLLPSEDLKFVNFFTNSVSLYGCTCDNEFYLFKKPLFSSFKYGQLFIDVKNNIYRLSYVGGVRSKSNFDCYVYNGKLIPSITPKLYGKKCIGLLNTKKILRTMLEFDKNYGSLLAKYRKELKDARKENREK